ncbi:leucine-rich repeat domain-containing protein [Aporhodopirellula aestuarii]|uniref:Transcriptional regulator n=1 Tax=Aporhodopirellula aestuarii TaxID=2950107 RepID=A0ABT0U5F8_9BACT|nr:transcriptional regulator [Aporhodopirellula aestuarii]MCM2371663.1 transcriptional regulator [Aporhodopirellula aestuarii]
MTASPDDSETLPPSPETETDEAASLDWKTRLRQYSKPLIAMALIAAIALLAVFVWYATRPEAPVAETAEPEIQISERKQFTEQVERVLAGKSTRLYFFDSAINNELLEELPLDTLIQESIEAAEQTQKTAENLPQTSDSDPGEIVTNSSQRGGRQGTSPPPAKTFAKLDTVLIDQGVVTDQGLAVIAQLPDLEHLRLRLSPITDEGIRSLAGCDKLWLLNLPHCRVSSAGIRSLKKLPKLKQLRLGSPNLNNECCRAIAELTTLRGLHLIGVPVTDEGIKVLTTLPRLESLYLDDSAITESGWSWLFRNHPQLHVHVNQKHHDRDPHAHVH